MKKFLFIFSTLFVTSSIFCQVDNNTLNETIGANLFGETSLWEESPLAVQDRLGIKFESTKANDGEIHSAYVKAKLCGADAREIKIESKKQKISSLKIVFFNKGDFAKQKGNEWTSSMSTKMRKDAKSIHDNISKVLNKPKLRRIGESGMKTKACEWINSDTIFHLLYEDKEFIILNIESKTATTSDDKSSDKVRKKELEKNVERNDNQDVIVKIPMVNQGDKGYCFPATIERILLYLGIEGIDMHKLADMFKTSAGGGTYLSDAIKPLEKLGRSKGFNVETMGIDFSKIAKNIDNGIPMAWLMFSTPEYNKHKTTRTTQRENKDIKDWKKSCAREKKLKTKINRDTAHICIILGYNKETKEVAVSDSWGGSEDTIFWIPFNSAKMVSQAPALLIFKPKN